MKQILIFMCLISLGGVTRLSGQAFHKGFFINFEISAIDLNGRGLFQEKEFDLKRDMTLLPDPKINPVYPDDVHTMRGWNWKNRFLIGAISEIGYRPISFLAFSIAFRALLPRTETSSARINAEGVTYSWNGEMNYSQANAQAVLQIYPLTRKYAFITLGWEWVFLNADGWFESTEKTDGSTSSVRSLFQGSGEAMGPVFGAGVDLNMPGDLMQLTVSFQYSLTRYEGASLLASPDGAGEFPSRKFELGVGGFSLNSGIKIFFTRSR